MYQLVCKYGILFLLHQKKMKWSATICFSVSHSDIYSTYIVPHQNSGVYIKLDLEFLTHSTRWANLNYHWWLPPLLYLFSNSFFLSVVHTLTLTETSFCSLFVTTPSFYHSWERKPNWSFAVFPSSVRSLCSSSGWPAASLAWGRMSGCATELPAMKRN